MIDNFAECIGHCMYWCESCACHRLQRRMGEEQISVSARRRKFFKERYGIKQCPMAGLRAKDFANGGWRNTLESCFRVASTSVDLAVHSSLDAAARKAIVDDFARARSHLSILMDVKLVVWEHLPMKAAGMADSNLVAARRRGAECLGLYEDAADTASLHWSARKLFGHGRRLREQVISFVGGANLSSLELRKLRSFLGRFSMMLTRKAQVEGLHAQVCVKLAPCGGRSYKTHPFSIILYYNVKN